MPRPESTDMATASDHRPGPSPGSEPRDEPPTRPITDALLSAIADDDRSIYALGGESGVHHQRIRQFVNHKVDLTLATADKLFNVLALKVVREPKAILDVDPVRPIAEVFRAAIANYDQSIRALDRATGVDHQTIRQFVLCESDPYLATADKLANVLALKVVREPKAILDVDPVRPITDALLSAIADDDRTIFALARTSGVHQTAIALFVRREADLFLATAEKLFNVLPLKVVRQLKASLDDHPVRPIADAIRAAIADDDRTIFALARTSGLFDQKIRMFVRSEADLKLATAEKLFNVLALKVVRQLKPPSIDFTQPSSDVLRSAIAGNDESIYALSRRSRVSSKTISRLLKGRDLAYSTRIKLSYALGLELEPAKILARPDAPPPSAAGPIPAPRDSATIEDKSIDRAASISQVEPPNGPKPRPTWPPGRCPVSFGADGSVIVAGQPKKVTIPQWKVIRALHDAGPAGLTGEELVEESGHTGYRHILDTLARDEDWRSRIRWAGDSHGRYRLAMPGYN
jgi:plasmid maintenance system antidote protein VapI